MSHNQNTSHAFHRSQSADLSQSQPRILMTHSSAPLPAMPAPRSFQRRTVESARHLRDSLSNVIREIEPLVETARTVNAGVSNFLNRPQMDSNAARPTTSDDNNSVVINLDGPSPTREENNIVDDVIHDHVANLLNPPPNANNNNADDQERMQTVIETQECIKILLKYVPFVLILVAKAVYDYHEGIFIFIILFMIFAHTNSAVKKEAIKRQRRSLSTLLIELIYVFVCLFFIHYIFEEDLYNFNILLNMVLIRTFNHPLTMWNLLWIVTITDFILKLFTVTVKILVTMLPDSVLEFKSRGKSYLFIEAVSQLYRSIATIQPWLYYLLESYQGPEKIVAVFLSAFYMISKGTDLMSKVRLLKSALIKLLQNVSIGTSPTKDQIQTAGDHCPICHDEYDSPVLLQCRHIFCESCVSTWFDREQTCPLCRAKIVDDPSWRDGSTSHFMQLF